MSGRRFVTPFRTDRAVALCLCLALAGCGSDGSTRIPLSGKVTQGDQPVPQGAISLVPAEGHQGVAANTQIKVGRYEFTRDDGPQPGPYKVTVMRSFTKDEADKRRREQNPSSPAPQVEWIFEIKVPSSGTASEDFRLESK